jgi:endo-1,4-beta-xylanase
MFHAARKRVYTFSCNRLGIASGVILCLSLLCASPIHAQVVAQYDFEDGTAQGWTSFNGASTPVN